MSDGDAAKPADDALLWFVERFALVLSESGMERMPSRVFAYVLAEDADRYTASELAEGLGVSRAAISTATRTLVQAGLLAREREPGARVDHYRVYDDDVWAAIFEQRLPLLERYRQLMAEGVEAFGPDGRGGRRLLQTLAYFEFMAEEMPKMIADWHRRKDELVEELAIRYEHETASDD